MTLLHLTVDRPFLTDGGLETSLLFQDGIELPDFAAFPLLDSEDGRAALTRYFGPYLDLAEETGSGFVLDTPTWRANLDWGVRLATTPPAWQPSIATRSSSSPHWQTNAPACGG
jgi:homocysteine S-methyltransferase